MATESRQKEFRMAPPLSVRARRFAIQSGRAMRSNPPLLMGVVIITTIVLIAIFAHVIVTEEYERVKPFDGFLAPSADHWFGTDRSGRDVFDRTIVGSRISLYVGFTVTAITIILGLSIGLISGYTRTLDNIIMRFVDGMMAFPTILLALAIIAVFGASLNNVILQARCAW
jgi:peptide/nickel transport system permease protein